MELSKLTSAEWEVSPTDGRPDAVRIHECPPGSKVAHGAVCDVYGPDKEDRARLIAASPKTTAALAVLIRDPAIAEWLAENDPKALQQGRDALSRAGFPAPDDSKLKDLWLWQCQCRREGTIFYYQHDCRPSHIVVRCPLCGSTRVKCTGRRFPAVNETAPMDAVA